MTEPVREKPVVIGKFTGVHGIAGWLKVMPYTQELTGVLEYQPWQVKFQGRTLALNVKAFKPYKNIGLIVQIEGYEDRDQAKLLVNHTFTVDRSLFPPLTDAHYWIDLQGLTVITTQGKTLGKVKELFESPAQTILVVDTGKGLELIPYVIGPIIKEVKLEAGMIIVDWEG